MPPRKARKAAAPRQTAAKAAEAAKTAKVDTNTEITKEPVLATNESLTADNTVQSGVSAVDYSADEGDDAAEGADVTTPTDVPQDVEHVVEGSNGNAALEPASTIEEGEHDDNEPGQHAEQPDVWGQAPLDPAPKAPRSRSRSQSRSRSDAGPNGRSRSPAKRSRDESRIDEGEEDVQGGNKRSANGNNNSQDPAEQIPLEEQTIHVRALVSSKEAGVIIGKAGANIHSIRDRSGTKINISPSTPRTQDRVMTIVGTIGCITEAVNLVAESLTEEPNAAPKEAEEGQDPSWGAAQEGESSVEEPTTEPKTDPVEESVEEGETADAPTASANVDEEEGATSPMVGDDDDDKNNNQIPSRASVASSNPLVKGETTTIRLLITNQKMGYIIGRSGSTIKSIQDKSKAKIAAHSELLAASTERAVTLEGKPEQIKIAVVEIYTILQSKSSPNDNLRGARLFMPTPGISYSMGALTNNRNQQSHGINGAFGGGNFNGRLGNSVNNNNNMNMNNNNNQFGGGRFQNNGFQPQRMMNGGPMNRHNNNMQQYPQQQYSNNRNNNNNNGGRYSQNNSQRGGPNGFRGQSRGGPYQQQNNDSRGGAYQNRQYQQFNNGYPPQGPPHGDNMMNPGQMVTQQIYVPKEIIGAIIGKGGNQINKIRHSSGCQIKIDESSSDNVNRLVSVTGPFGGVQHAASMLQERIGQETSKLSQRQSFSMESGESAGQPSADQ